MPTYRLNIPGVPIGQPRAKATTIAGRVRMYNPKHPVDVYRASIRLAAAAAGVEPTEGGVSLEVSAFFPLPKSKRRTLLVADAISHTTKPDIDNILKAIQDALSGVAYHDDKQIDVVTITKNYTDGSPRTELAITTED